jgi:hypothetical protein
MSSRGFYIAGAVFLAAVFLYYVFDLHRPGPSSNAPPQAAAIINIDPATISQFQVKSAGKTLTVLRNGAEWRYSVCPSAQADCPTSVADTNRALALLGVILQLRPTKTIFGAPEGLPAYGLDTATVGEVDVQTPSGRSMSLLVGAKTQDSVSYYVRLSTSNDILTVPAATLQTQVIGAISAPPAPVPSPSPIPSPLPSPSHS